MIKIIITAFIACLLNVTSVLGTDIAEQWKNVNYQKIAVCQIFRPQRFCPDLEEETMTPDGYAKKTLAVLEKEKDVDRVWTEIVKLQKVGFPHEILCHVDKNFANIMEAIRKEALTSDYIVRRNILKELLMLRFQEFLFDKTDWLELAYKLFS